MANPMLVVTGERFNLLETGTITVTSADALYPSTYLFDGRPSLDFRFSAAGTDDSISVDGNAISNGNLNTWAAGAPSGWTVTTVDTGTVTEATSSGVVISGSAAKLSPGSSGSAAISVDVTARSGQYWTFQAGLLGDSTGTIHAKVQNRQTGKYLTSAGAWTTGSTDAAANTTNAYVVSTINAFAVETFSTCLSDTVTLRVTLNSTNASAEVYADDVYLWPAGIDLISVHGHNIDPSISPIVTSSTDNFSTSTTQATMTVGQPSFYSLIATKQNYRYWKLTLTGTNTNPIQIGEMVIAQSLALQRTYGYGAEIQYLEDRIASDSQSGDRYVYSINSKPRRTLGMKFMFTTLAELTEALNEVFRRARGDRFPMVIVPDTTLPDVLFGHIDRSWRVVRTLTIIYEDNDLTMTESPFPVSAQ